MNGIESLRGFIAQSLIAMIECLERTDWDAIILVPNSENDRVDIQLYRDGLIITSIQVKSSKYKFSRPEVELWLNELRASAGSAKEILLYLVGDNYTFDCEIFIAHNSKDIQKVSLENLETLCLDKLTQYAKNEGLSQQFSISDLDYVQKKFFSEVYQASIDGSVLTRAVFEEAFRSALVIKGTYFEDHSTSNNDFSQIDQLFYPDTAKVSCDSSDRHFVLIGVGGSGISVLKKIKTSVERLLNNTSIYYLCIDSDDYELNSVSDTFTDVERLYLNPPIDLSNPKFKEMAKGITVNDYIADGRSAGSDRMYGRLLLLSHASVVRDRLRSIIFNICPSPYISRKLNIHVISGLSGGTGGGSFIDVCYILRDVLRDLHMGAAEASVTGLFMLDSLSIQNQPLYLRHHFQENALMSLQDLQTAMNLKSFGSPFSQNYGQFSITTFEPPLDRYYLFNDRENYTQNIVDFIISDLVPLKSEISDKYSLATYSDVCYANEAMRAAYKDDHFFRAFTTLSISAPISEASFAFGLALADRILLSAKYLSHSPVTDFADHFTIDHIIHHIPDVLRADYVPLIPPEVDAETLHACIRHCKEVPEDWTEAGRQFLAANKERHEKALQTILKDINTFIPGQMPRSTDEIMKDLFNKLSSVFTNPEKGPATTVFQLDDIIGILKDSLSSEQSKQLEFSKEIKLYQDKLSSDVRKASGKVYILARRDLRNFRADYNAFYTASERYNAFAGRIPVIEALINALTSLRNDYFEPLSHQIASFRDTCYNLLEEQSQKSYEDGLRHGANLSGLSVNEYIEAAASQVTRSDVTAFLTCILKQPFTLPIKGSDALTAFSSICADTFKDQILSLALESWRKAFQDNPDLKLLGIMDRLHTDYLFSLRYRDDKILSRQRLILLPSTSWDWAESTFSDGYEGNSRSITYISSVDSLRAKVFIFYSLSLGSLTESFGVDIRNSSKSFDRFIFFQKLIKVKDDSEKTTETGFRANQATDIIKRDDRDESLSNDESAGEVKVVFLGDATIGKTLTIKRILAEGALIPDYKNSATRGIQISRTSLATESGPITVRFWDFGGQDIYYAMHRLFFSDHTLYVVMINARESHIQDKAIEWLDIVASSKPTCPILLIVNQTDQIPEPNILVDDLMASYHSLKGVYFLSAKTFDRNKFSKNVILPITKAIESMKDEVFHVYPEAWQKVRARIMSLRQDYITDREFADICDECGVGPERNERINILKWLRDLGLGFSGSPMHLGESFTVLKPEWITRALYFLLDYRSYFAGGITTAAICHDVQEAKRREGDSEAPNYYISDYEFILDTLCQFRLAYQLDFKRYLIPMLCTAADTGYGKDLIKDPKALHYHMDFHHLPVNVLHRLCVEMSASLITSSIWAHGCAFELAGEGRRRHVLHTIRHGQIMLSHKSRSTKSSGNKSLVNRRLLCNLDRHQDKKLRVLAHLYRNSLYLHVRSTDSTCPSIFLLERFRQTILMLARQMNLSATNEQLDFIQEGKKQSVDYKVLQESLSKGDPAILSFWENNHGGPVPSISHSTFLNDLVYALSCLQDEYKYADENENSRTAYVCSLLRSRHYIVAEQQPGGASGTGRSRGIPDVTIYDGDRTFTLLEALNVKCNTFINNESAKAYLRDHIEKILDRYNSHGLPRCYLLVYLNCNKSSFKNYYEEYQNFVLGECGLKNYTPVNHLTHSDKDNSFLKILEVCYDCAGTSTILFHIIVRLMTEEIRK